jgi:hypothetical protein
MNEREQNHKGAQRGALSLLETIVDASDWCQAALAAARRKQPIELDKTDRVSRASDSIFLRGLVQPNRVA